MRAMPRAHAQINFGLRWDDVSGFARSQQLDSMLNFYLHRWR
jgi:hypothetical protein